MFFSCSVGHSSSNFFLVGHSSFLLVPYLVTVYSMANSLFSQQVEKFKKNYVPVSDTIVLQGRI